MPPSGTTVSRVITKEELCLLEQAASACGIIIFGASGDLTHRKLLPSLFSLAQDHLLPPSYYILGVARSPWPDSAFQAKVLESLGEAGTAADRTEFVRHCGYLPGDYADPSTYEALLRRLSALDSAHETAGRHLVYLSTPPALYETIVGQLYKHGFADSR